jgi:hypothetical protein
MHVKRIDDVLSQGTPRESQRCALVLATLAEQFVSCQQLALLMQDLEDPNSR